MTNFCYHNSAFFESFKWCEIALILGFCLREFTNEFECHVPCLIMVRFEVN